MKPESDLSAMTPLARLNDNFRGTALEALAFGTETDAHDLLRVGLPVSATRVIASLLGIRENELCEALQITAAEEAKDCRLPTADSAKIVRVMRVLQHATATMEDEDVACRWLVCRIRPLGSVTPLSLLATTEGHALVIATLKRIELGIVS